MIIQLLLFVILAFTFSLSSSSAQETFPASGGDAKGSGGSVSYSVGQLFYIIHTGTAGSVAEGVQQPFEISVVTGIQDAIGINLVFSAFPNPAFDYLILRVDNYDFENLEYFLYNVSGRPLKEGKITAFETTISVASLVPAVYFVKVIQTIPSYQEVKTFRIIKH